MLVAEHQAVDISQGLAGLALCALGDVVRGLGQLLAHSILLRQTLFARALPLRREFAGHALQRGRPARHARLVGLLLLAVLLGVGALDSVHQALAALVKALAEGVQGFLKRGELAQGQELTDFSEGQSITSFVATMDRKGRSISLAIRAQEAAQQRVQMQELNTKPVESEGPTTIGDLIKEQLKK